jgi:phosphosulfolactate synthase
VSADERRATSERVVHDLISALLDPGLRTAKPRRTGLTMMLDKQQFSCAGIRDLVASTGGAIDCAKIAWGSALVDGCLETRLATYRELGIAPMLGGTLFEYAWLRAKVPVLLELVRALRVHVEISDGVIEVPRRDKLRWIEQFARETDVWSELGGKTAHQDRDWKVCIAEERSAGASKVVIEGREIAPVGQEIREQFVDSLIDGAGTDHLVFEALERRQQVWLIKRLGPNVNLGNILPADVLTVECFRRGLKEHTLLSTFAQLPPAAERPLGTLREAASAS